MARSKTIPPDSASMPSLAEVATLAARFLPRIELPDDWQASEPETLRRNVGGPTGTPFPHNPEYRPEPGWRLPWEVVCEEAVKRARILLDAAAGKVRPEVAEWDSETDEARKKGQAQDLAAGKLRKEFDKMAGERLTLPILEVLKYCLPRASSDELRMRYFMHHYRSDIEAYNARHKITGEPVMEDQTDRQVCRREFPILVMNFKAAYAIHGDAWRKIVAREAGTKGQEKSLANRRRTESSEKVPRVINKRETKQLKTAARRHSSAKS